MSSVRPVRPRRPVPAVPGRPPAAPAEIRRPEAARPVIPGTAKRIGALALTTGTGARAAGASRTARA